MKKQNEIIIDGILFKECKNYYPYYASSCGKIYSTRMSKEVKQSNHNHGYLCVSNYNGYNKKSGLFLSHRLVADAWIDFTPEDNRKTHIDHINCNKKDNRVENLRYVSARKNTSIDRVNVTGFTGVKACGKYSFQAQIRVMGTLIYLGSYKTPEQAHARYNIARLLLS